MSEHHLFGILTHFSEIPQKRPVKKNRYMHNTKGNRLETEQSCSLGSAKQRDNVSFAVSSSQVQAAWPVALLTPERNRLSSPAKAIPRHSLRDWHSHAKCWLGVGSWPHKESCSIQKKLLKQATLFLAISSSLIGPWSHPSSLILWVAWPTLPGPNRIHPQVFFFLPWGLLQSTINWFTAVR